jgi:hypothetical protein
MTRALAVAMSMMAVLSAAEASALVLDDENRITVTLAGGTPITLIGQASSLSAQKTSNYYYLPSPGLLRLARRPDGTPEFLFLKFTTEKSAAKGGMSGGLMHFLMEWSLTPAQETELKAKLAAEKPGAQLLGAVPLEPEGESGSFQIVSASLSDKTLAPTVLLGGKAPPLPGGGVAAASRLTAEGAQLLAATFEKSRSITDVSIVLNYKYTVLTPAIRGRITVDWTKLQKEKDQLKTEYEKKSGSCFMWWCGAPTYSYKEVREQFRFLEEKKVIVWQLDEMVADERAAKIRDAFLQYLLNLTTQPPPPDEPPPAAADKDKEAPNTRQGRKYTFSQTSMKRAFERKTETLDLNVRLSVKWPHQLVANLASWYDGARNNPKCVAAVNLNDPFFQHRDIHFILDLDAKEMFDEAVNYVTVNVRKRRSAGNPFEDRVTLDAKYVKENGINASVTYARGEDKDPDAYEYQAQWSLKGGQIFPNNPPWQRGSWEGVTLSPPVVPRTIEVEGDLAAMAASGITRVTVQVHYPKFGREVEENIHISPAANEALVKRKLFMDRGARGYAYRLIVNHKTEGKLALPWSAQVGDDYVYAAIPAELLTEPQVRDEAKEAAKTIASSASDQVLAKFRELAGETK